MSRSKLKTLVLINWRGVFYQPFDMDKYVTSLTGLNGAGKTTVMAGVYVSLLPDKTLLDLRNQAGKGVSSKKQGLYGKFGPGNVSYSIIELVTSAGQRVLAGVQIRKKAAPEFELIPFVIQNVNPDIKIEDIFLVRDGKTDTIIDSATTTGMNELSSVIKAMSGNIKTFKGRVGEYMSTLYELGLMPMRLNKVGERKKFNKLLQTSLFGGLSGEIQQSLKDYLLDKDTTLSSQISRAESNLATCKQTREAIERTEKNRLLIENVYKSVSEVTAAVIADIKTKYSEAKSSAITARKDLSQKTKEISLFDSKLDEIENGIDEKKELTERLSSALQEKEDLFKRIEKADLINEQIADKETFVNDQTATLEQKTNDLSALETELESLTDQESKLTEQVNLIVRQLVDANETFNIETKKAGLYKAAKEAERLYFETFPDSKGDSEELTSQRKDLEVRKNEIVDEVFHLKTQFEEYNQGKTQFTQAFSQIKNLTDQIPNLLKEDLTEENAYDSSHKIIESLRTIEDKLRELDFTKRELHEAKIQSQNIKDILIIAEPLGISNSSDYNEKIETLEDLIDVQKGQISSSEHELFELEDELKEKETLHKQSFSNAKKQAKASEIASKVSEQTGISISSPEDIEQSKTFAKEKKETLLAEKYELTLERKNLTQKVSDLGGLKTFDDDRLIEVAGEIGGDLMSDLLDHLDLEEAAKMEAKLGPLKHAISVEDPEKALDDLIKSKVRPDEVYLVNKADLEQNLVSDVNEDRMIIKDSRSIRVSRVPKNPTLGADARDRETERLERKISKISERLVNIEIEYETLAALEELILELSQIEDLLFQDKIDDKAAALLSEIDEITEQIEELSEKVEELQSDHDSNLEELSKLKKYEHVSYLLDEKSIDGKLADLETRFKQLSSYKAKYGNLLNLIPSLQKEREYLRFKSQFSKEEISELLKIKEDEKKSLTASIRAIEEFDDLKEYLRYEKSSNRISSEGSLNEDLNLEKEQIEAEIKIIKEKISAKNKVINDLTSQKDTARHLIDTYGGDILKLRESLSELEIDQNTTRDELNESIELTREELSVAKSRLDDLKSELTSLTTKIQLSEDDLRRAFTTYRTVRSSEWYPSNISHNILNRSMRSEAIFSSVNERAEELISQDKVNFSSHGGRSLAELKNALLNHVSGKGALISEILESIEQLMTGAFATEPEKSIELFRLVHGFMEQQLPRDIIDADNPLEALSKMSIHIQKLRLKLKHHENDFSTSSNDVAYGIEQKIRKEFRNIARLNDGLDKVKFGNIRSIQIKFQKKPGMDSILQALLNKGQESPLFNQNSDISFEEALQKLYETHIGKKFTGESLLDFRHYIELQVQIKRAADNGWENADSNRLSTGESIGVGLSILLMVLQSWETNTMRITGKRHESLRFLFLDEASRLDISSINTLASLCGNMGLQLLIAAPSADEAITGTTYCLNRVVDTKGKEKVIVRGLRGFKKENQIEFSKEAFEAKETPIQKPLGLAFETTADTHIQ